MQHISDKTIREVIIAKAALDKLVLHLWLDLIQEFPDMTLDDTQKFLMGFEYERAN